MSSKALKRQQVQELLLAADYPALVCQAATDGSLLTLLLQFTFAPNTLLSWRATEVIGELAVTQPNKVARLIPRLLWSLNEDSGSFGWGAAAILGEIGRRNYALVAEIIEILLNFINDDFAREGMLWGLGRLAQVHPEAVQPAVAQIQACLTHTNPQVRAYAAWCLGILQYQLAKSDLQQLVGDQQPVILYDQGRLEETTVGRIAAQALERLAAGPQE